jgi:hypothetical protein
VGKALASIGTGEMSPTERSAAEERAARFDTAFVAHLTRLAKDPSAFGRSSLNAIFEFREECLRDNGFADAYAPDKVREPSSGGKLHDYR